MTESVIQSELFPRDFCMSGYNLSINWFKYIVLFSLIIPSAFEFKWKNATILSYHHFVFFKTLKLLLQI